MKRLSSGGGGIFENKIIKCLIKELVYLNSLTKDLCFLSSLIFNVLPEYVLLKFLSSQLFQYLVQNSFLLGRFACLNSY